ncbi:MAG: MarR family transcriptional regulator [Sulfuritalea sp.]|nr:MarR family transcriptional regulator [Sulfuritalea sp.]
MTRPRKPETDVAPGQKNLGRSSSDAKLVEGGAADEAFGKVLRLVRTVQTGMQNIDSSHGLSGSQLWALWQISAQPGQRVKELADALHIHPSTASNMLDKLEARGFVRRERRDLDNRVVRLYLAKAGLKLVKEIPGPMKGQLRHALQQLSTLILAGLLKGVTIVLDLMDE